MLKVTGLVHPENLNFALLVIILVSVNWIRQLIGRIFVLRLGLLLLVVIKASASYLTVLKKLQKKSYSRENNDCS